MVEKVVTKKSSKEVNTQIDQILLENFVALQRVITEQNIKIDALTTQISALLKLFEVSAKTIVERDYSKEINDNQKIAQQLQNLTEQNKVLARGLSMLHEQKRDDMMPSPKMLPENNFGEEKRFNLPNN